LHSGLPALVQPSPLSQGLMPGQLAAAPHAPLALQSTSHAHELSQSTEESQESLPQVTSQLPVPHVIGPPQA